MITYDDFAKIELRVGTVRAAERVQGSQKLINLSVDMGTEEGRRLVAGIGSVYEPQELIGAQVVVVVNLSPRAIMGIESNGMLLACDGKNGPVLLSPISEVNPGSAVK